jgi:hypothetical protein
LPLAVLVSGEKENSQEAAAKISEKHELLVVAKSIL